jgi:hypothetical protein
VLVGVVALLVLQVVVEGVLVDTAQTLLLLLQHPLLKHLVAVGL